MWEAKNWISSDPICKSIHNILTCFVCVLMMRSECGWGLGRGIYKSAVAEDFKMELLRRGSCLDVAHVAVNLVQRFIMQENPILMYTLCACQTLILSRKSMQTSSEKGRCYR